MEGPTPKSPRKRSTPQADPAPRDADDASTLLELLARQHDLYAQLRELARQQRGLIAAADPSGLLDLLTKRQTLVGELARLNARIEPLRADWTRVEASLSADQRRRATETVEQVGRLLAEILESDQADARAIEARGAGRDTPKPQEPIKP